MVFNALAIDILRTHDYSTLVSMMRDYPDDYEVMLLVGEVTSTLIGENYEQELFALTDLLLDADVENGDKLTQELNSFKIFVSAEFIGYPLTVLSAVVEIKH